MDILARKIRHYRRLSGLSTEEAAKRLGVKPSVFADYENGSDRPSFEEVVRLAHIFCTTTDQLLDHRHLP